MELFDAVPWFQSIIYEHRLVPFRLDPDPDLRLRVDRVLRDFDIKRSVVKELGHRYEQGDAVARLNAVRLCRHLGSYGVLLPVRALSDPEEEVRRAAVDVLAELGPVAGLAIPALERAMASEDAGLRAAARKALDRIRPPGSQPK